MRWLLIASLVIVVVGSLYWFWTTTPFFAFQEAASAVEHHDAAKFHERVDVRGFVDSLLDDLLAHPAHTTPGLSRFQHEVAAAAIVLARTPIEEQLIKAIEKLVDKRPPNLSFWGEPPAFASGSIAPSDIRDLLKVTTHELAGSANRLSHTVYQRMQMYARQHQSTAPGFLLACSPHERIERLRHMLADDGLSAENFRGIASYDTAHDGADGELCNIGFLFYSPRVNHNVVLHVELYKGSMFSLWQIKRLTNLYELFRSLGEDYEGEMHALVFNSLSGIDDKAVRNEARGLGQRITESEAAQNLFRKLDLR